MTYSSNELARLSLHDSTLESAAKRGTDLELVFDWAKLAHLTEENVAEPVILGRTVLSLAGISEALLTVFEDNLSLARTSFAPESAAEINLIISNELLTPTTLLISGLLAESAGSNWAEWRATFATCRIFWNSHVTHTEWLAGKLPSDCD